MTTIKINVDNKTFQVESGTNLFSELRSAGLLESLCYHSTLKSEKNCSLCLVEVEDEMTGKKELISSCQKIITSPIKVSIEKSSIASLRQSILSLWIHHFQSIGIYSAKRLLKKITLLFRTNSPLLFRLSQIDKRERKLERWSPNLVFDSRLCVGCGLCVDFVLQSQKMKILDLQLVGGHFNIIKDGILDKNLEKSLSLACPTEAIEHFLPHSFDSTVFPPIGQWNVTYKGESFVVRSEKRKVFVEPLESHPFLSASIYELIQRYHPDFIFRSIVHPHSSLASLKCLWFLGSNVPKTTLDCIQRVVLKRREKVISLYPNHSTELKSHYLAPEVHDRAILVLGPEDELRPEDLLKYNNVAMVVLSRYSQWHGRPMTDYPEIIWAPQPDVFEIEGDERFPRHFNHTVQRLSL